MTNPQVDEQSMMTYLSQFMKAFYKPNNVITLTYHYFSSIYN